MGVDISVALPVPFPALRIFVAIVSSSSVTRKGGGMVEKVLHFLFLLFGSTSCAPSLLHDSTMHFMSFFFLLGLGIFLEKCVKSNIYHKNEMITVWRWNPLH